MTAPPLILVSLAIFALATATRAADIAIGDVTSDLGPDFFFDAAATGGGDNNATTFTRDISGYWTPGSTVTLQGLGWAGSSGGTTASSATVTFTDSGADGSFGTGDDVVVGSVTDNLVFTGVAGEFVWDFDSDMVFTATGSALRIRIVGNDNIRRKTAATGTGQADVKLSLAGTAVGGGPPPVVNTATGSGFWDAIDWEVSSGGTATGNLNDDDTAEIGSYREVTYRGVPAGEVVNTLHLGETGSSGQATLRVTSGSLSTTGALRVGLGAEANDSFLHVDGGSLQIGGDALFGRFSGRVDGSLIVAGGTVEIGGNLEMGGFDQGGSMLRIHNPGSSPPVAVGGTLVLDRSALDLTFDSGYIHVPGTVVTLATFAARKGQFLNFRQGQEFNCGPNRFRIDYSQSSITLTALPKWTPPAVRPNIILIFADDGGYADLGMQGNSKFPTPEIDSLAAAGVRFTDHYMTGGVCHSSRCGLLSGVYQQRYGTEGNISATAPASNGVGLSHASISRRLQGLGYRTYGIGKWHLGFTVEHHPNLQGFDRWYGMWSGSRSYYNAPGENQVFQDQMTPDFSAENSAYLTDRIGDSAVAFIDEHLASPHATEPFYIYVSFTAIHAPMDMDGGDPRFARLQSEFGLTAADYNNSPIVFGGSNQTTVDANRYELAAMTLAMDEQVGKVRAKLAAEGLANNTLVVYTNDNGGAGWTSSSGGNYSYNTPLRGYKGGSMRDGSIRVPAAAAWPGTIPAGQTVTEPVIALDWGATFINAGGTSPAAARNGLDGLDLMPLLRDGTPLPADRALCWRAGGSDGGGSAARMGDWKMWIGDPGGTPMLYNLRSDIGENTDLAASQPAILANLYERFLAWEQGTLLPLYGASGIDIDADIDYWPISGGLRLKTDSPSPLWLSGSLRSPLALSSDFSRSFLIRATEPGPHPAGSGVWHGLGESTNRAQFIRAGIDFNSSTLLLVEGKSGQSAAVPLPSLPTSGFATAVLDYRAATRTLTLSLGGTSVSLVIPNSYSSLTHTAMGASAMEGELTMLRAMSPGSMPNAAATTIDASANPLLIELDLGTAPPFAPRMERSPGLTRFTPDPETLVEPLGGGIYRVSAPASGLPAEFFRFRSDQP